MLFAKPMLWALALAVAPCLAQSKAPSTTLEKITSESPSDISTPTDLPTAVPDLSHTPSSANVAPPTEAPASEPTTNTIITMTRRQTQGGTPADAEYCSPVIQQYSPARWVWGEFKFCFDVSAAETTVYLQVFRAMYYWGGAWYNANGKEYHWSTIAGPVGGPASRQPVDDGTASGGFERDIGDITPPLKAGKYSFVTLYTQSGPYWPEERFTHKQSYEFDIAAT